MNIATRLCSTCEGTGGVFIELAAEAEYPCDPRCTGCHGCTEPCPSCNGDGVR